MNGLLQAERYYSSGLYTKAIHIYETILKDKPEDALAHQGLARCYMQVDKIDDSYDECMKALQLNQKLTIPLVTLGSIYLRRENIEEAEQYIRKALRQNPNEADAYIVLSTIYLDRKKFQDGISALHKAIELEPAAWKAHYNLGMALTNQESHSTALSEFWLAFSLHPSKLTAHPILVATLIGKNSVWPAIVVGILYSVALAIHSVKAVPLAAITTIYFLARGYFFKKARENKLFVQNIFLAILFLIMYLIYVNKLPPIF